MRAREFRSEVAAPHRLQHQRQGTGQDEKTTPKLHDASHGISFASFTVRFSLQTPREEGVMLK
jgi:hypothetical protein